MTDETVFTRIVAGDLPSETIYADGTASAFLDANPVAPGHTLVVPNSPYRRLQEMPPEEASALLSTLYELVPAIERAVGADATTIVLNNGPEAGQEVAHVHWHVIPRFDDDGTLVEYHSLLEDGLDESERASIADAIRDEL
ncbi:HIT family protein [Halovivax gelatinilyticus]|uniref:HIT family protein n=1 Tax=Halovivax gelatinilyticus TaxID=2961597 RepID=UPI0020CA779C|nr:HIT family protein [Halovivax gelatinilyticus]